MCTRNSFFCNPHRYDTNAYRNAFLLAFFCVSIPHRYDTNPQKSVDKSTYGKAIQCYYISIRKFSQSLYALIRLKNSQKINCRRSPGVFARLEVDDSCEIVHKYIGYKKQSPNRRLLFMLLHSLPR